MPKYATRFARLPAVFEMLLAHPDGVPLATLADEVGVPADELREDLLAFYTADPLENDRMLGLWRPPVLEFLGPDGDDDPVGDRHVADEAGPPGPVDDRPPGELQIEHGRMVGGVAHRCH